MYGVSCGSPMSAGSVRNGPGCDPGHPGNADPKVELEEDGVCIRSVTLTLPLHAQ
jgi:hypothetical protein